MFGSVMLDVAIGLVFFFAFLSVLCSGVTEMIGALLSRRSTYLEDALRNLFVKAATSPDQQELAFANRFFGHALISQLTPPNKTTPSYVPPRTFAATVMDLVLAGEDKAAAAIAPAGLRADPSFDQLKAAVETLTNTRVKDSLMPLLATAEGKVEKFRLNVEAWFDSAMAAVSGVYKRWTVVITLGVALVVSVGLNADALAIINHLSQNPDARKALVDQARTELGAAPAPAAASAAPQANATLKAAGLPLGWDARDGQDPWDGRPWWSKLIGLLMTTIAVSLGAPFWFDLMGKLVNLRFSSPKPQPSGGAPTST